MVFIILNVGMDLLGCGEVIGCKGGTMLKASARDTGCGLIK